MIVRHDAEPYVGLRPYDIADAGLFFGRAREAWELTSVVLSSRLVVVYGPSGVGKTSLLQAGVLAGLSDDMAQLLPVGQLARVATLPTDVAPHHNPLVFELLSSWAPDRSTDELRALSIRQLLRGIPARSDRYGDADLPLVAVVDQAEALFRRGPEWAEHCGDLVDDLAAAMNEVPRLHLVLSMRQDAVGELLPYESKVASGNRRRYRVEPLDRDAALDAVNGPLRVTGRRFAPGVAEALVDRLRTTTIVNEVDERRTLVSRTVEPANLQVVCSALWRGLPDDITTITMDHVEAFGDPLTTLTNFCVRAVIDVATREGVPEPEVWDWLERTFVTEHGTRGAVYEGIAWTGGMPKSVARAFERHRILRSEERSGSLWFELLHDGLIEPIRRGHRLAAGLAVEESPGASPDVYLRLAEGALHSGDVALAEGYAQGAVRASEDDPRTLAEASSFLGKLVFDQGTTATGARRQELYASAAEHYRRAMELFETEQNSRAVGQMLASLGRVRLEQGRFADAVESLQGALQRLEGDVEIRLDLARALHLAGQHGAALGEYIAVLAIAPGTVEALVGRGAIDAEHGDAAAALRDLDEAVRRDPTLARRSDVVTARSRAMARLQQRGDS
jgi:tetratricopeptide (TPR) repeat protein